MRALAASAAVVLFLLGGCATTGGGDPRDPFEPVNRTIYKFNDGFDKVLAKPAAEAYRAIVPDLVRTGIGNVFSNIGDVIVALNNALQGKVPDAINDVGRILVNTTLGILGWRDVATELGVPKNNEDFGQTLGRWGFRDGPYIVLPILGPSSLRDTFGWVGDIYTNPLSYIDPTHTRNSVIAFRFVTVRADLLEATNILDTAALDPYEFVRDAYLQRRRNLVYDGSPPADKAFDLEPEGKPQAKPEQKMAPKPEIKPGAKPEIKKPVSEAPSPAQPASAGAGAPEERAHAVQPLAAAPAERPKTPRFTRIWLPTNR